MSMIKGLKKLSVLAWYALVLRKANVAGLALLLAWMPAMAGVSNSWQGAVYDERSNIVTPHIPWAKPYAGGTMRALVIGGDAYQRETVELMQRLSAECVPFMGKVSAYEISLGGKDAIAVLNKRLAEPFDVILVAGPFLQRFPPEVVEALIKKIQAGAGLVCFQPTDKPLALWQALGHVEKPRDSKSMDVNQPENAAAAAADELLSELSGADAWKREALAYLTNGIPRERIAGFQPAAVKQGEPPPALVSVYRCGKGRAVLIQYAGKTPLLTPEVSSDLLYEYCQAFVIKAALWAAGREPDVLFAGLPAALSDRPEAIKLALANRGGARKVALKMSVRTDRELQALPETPWAAPGVRNAETSLRPVHEESRQLDLVEKGATPFTLALPSLPAGEYFIDLEISSDKGKLNWATIPWTVTTPWTIASLVFDPDAVDLARTNRLSAAVELTKPAPAGAALELALVDNHNRVLLMQRADLREGVRCVAFDIFLSNPMTTLFKVRAALNVNGKVTDIKTGYFTVFNRPWPVFGYYAWGCGGAGSQIDRHLRRLAAQEGVDASSGGVNLESLRIADLRAVGSVAWRCDSTIEPGGMMIVPCPSDPAYRDVIRKGIKTTAQGRQVTDGFGYTTGDETTLTSAALYGACCCEHCTVKLHAYLREQYGSIEALNREWGTEYRKFEAVRGLDDPEAYRKQAIASGNWSSRVDQWLFNYHAYMDWFKFTRSAMRYYMPGARFGIQTCCFYGHERGYDFPELMAQCDFASPYGPWNWPGYFECVQAFAGPETSYGGHMGGYVSPLEVDEKYMGQQPYYILMRGGAHAWFYAFGIGWAGNGPGGVLPYLDLYPCLARYGESVRDIKRGLGELILHATREYDPVAIYYSSPNIIFSSAISGPRHINALSSFNTTLYELGFQARILDRQQVLDGALEKHGIRVLMLPMVQCLGDDEADVIRAFLEKGGMVIADYRPAIADGHGKILPQTAGIKLFGLRWNEKLRTADDKNTLMPLAQAAGAVSAEYAETAMKNVAVSGLVDKALVLDGAKALAELGGTPVLTVNPVGSGAAVCLNLPVSRPALNLFLAARGLRPRIAAADAPGTNATSPGCPGLELTRYADGPARYYGIFSLMDIDSGMGVRIKLNCRSHIFEIGGAYLGESDVIEVADLKQRVKLFAVLPYRAPGLQVKIENAPARPGGRINGTIAIDAAGVRPVRHVVHMSVDRPDGEEAQYLARNLETKDGETRFDATLALNEPAGVWKIRFRDVATGTETSTTVEVKSGPVRQAQGRPADKGGGPDRVGSDARQLMSVPERKIAPPPLAEQLKAYPGAALPQRIDIVERIGAEKCGNPEALRVLGQAAGDPDPLLSWCALRILTDLGPSAAAAAPEVAATLRQDNGVRIAPLQTLRRMGAAAVRLALPDIARCLEGDDAFVRFEALLTIDAAEKSADTAAYAKILECWSVHDVDKKILDSNLLAAYLKALAVFPLNKLSAPIYARALTGFQLPIMLTLDEQREIQHAEMRRLSSYYDKILRLDLENNYEYRLMAAKALQNIGPDAGEALPALIRSLEDLFVKRERKNSNCRIQTWLNKLPDDQPLADKDNLAAIQVCAALGAIGSPAKAAMPVLKKISRESPPALAEAARAAIKKIDPSGTNDGDLEEALSVSDLNP